MNNITIELCAEDRARIDNLTAALEKFHDVVTIKLTPEQTQRTADLAEQISEPQPAVSTVPAATTPKAEPTPEPVEEPTPAPVAEPEKAQPEKAQPEKAQPEKAQPEKEVTVEELRAKVMQLINAGKKDATRAIITSYAPNVTEIPADKRAEVLKKLNALEG